MALTKETKTKVIKDYKQTEKDTGSPEVQIAMLTERINGLTPHFEAHIKDHHSRYGLIKMVSQRKKLLAYVRKHSQEKYQELIKRLELRK